MKVKIKQGKRIYSLFFYFLLFLLPFSMKKLYLMERAILIKPTRAMSSLKDHTSSSTSITPPAKMWKMCLTCLNKIENTFKKASRVLKEDGKETRR
jgi:hypothetical protein